VLSLSLRLWNIGESGFNSDEAVYSGQAASLAGVEEFNQHFSLFRAHPLLLQFFVSIAFTLFGVSDIVARSIPVVFGVSTILVTYFVAKNLFNINTAIVSTLILSILPYHITMTRQVFVDIPLSFFYLLTLLFLIKYIKTNRSTWMYAIGISSGLCFISKETGLFSLVSIAFCMIIVKKLTFKFSLIVISLFLFISSPFLLPPLLIEDANNTLLQYYEWQRDRESSASNTFYLQILLNHGLGYILTGLYIVSIIYMVRTFDKSSPYLLLLIWIAIPLIFYHLLPLKGYNYLLSVIPPLVITGSSILFSVIKKYQWPITFLVILLIPISLDITKEFPIDNKKDLPTSGPLPYVREAAMWIKENTNNESKILAIHSSTANIIQFYSNRDGIPLKSNNNPAYTSLDNADLSILNSKIDYLIYEPHISEKFPSLDSSTNKMKQYIARYNATLVFSIFSEDTDMNAEEKNNRPIISIYKIRD
jgi:4-amino-4-deoxy-L-arabinose transferase-like glycosyltransferase